VSRTVIVSDLHVDTWDNRKYGRGDRRKTKLKHWCDFLDWCEAKDVDELVINGDLTDAPPYRGNVSFASSIERRAIARLIAYAGRRQVTYVYGNHDIGISGIRCHRNSTLPPLRNVNLIYPDYVLRTGGSTILIQHGHLFDPVLWLYVRDLTLRTYIRSDFQAFQWVQQRRHPRTGRRLRDPGVDSPARINLGPDADNNVYYAIRLTDTLAPPSKKEVGLAQTWISRLRGRVNRKLAGKVKHYLWWEAAKKVCKDYLRKAGDHRPVLYCVMGHTHVPDTGETQIRGKHCI